MEKTKKADRYYLPRDISWMYFNARILKEATKPSVPLLERLSFLGIYSNNLDEFFRVRVASLNRLAACDEKAARNEREPARRLLKQINKLNEQYAAAYGDAVRDVMKALAAENICVIDETAVDGERTAFIRSYYDNRLNGSVNPVWLSALHGLGLETDENIFLAVRMQKEGKSGREYALIELPVARCGRFVRLPDRDGKCFLMYLDDVVRCCLPLIFSGLPYSRFEAFAFKFTKDAEMEIDNDLRNGTMQKISKGIKSRKRGQPLRIVYDSRMPKDLLKRILDKLKTDKLDTVLPGGRYQNHKDLMHFPDCGRSDLKYPAWPALRKFGLSGESSLLDSIRTRDRFIHVPYHSFDTYIRLLQEAAIHKEVKSIRTTLYRLAHDSKVVEALICAARNGKKVTVVIELLARFDEAPNIAWSKKMQDAGIHVVFGVEGLKIHSKITHIALKGEGHVACISTGNFHEGNARCYTDYLLMTARPSLVREVGRVFDFIERPYAPTRFRELLVSPNDMRKGFIRLIDTEIRNHKAGKPAYIRMKLNHITDPVMVQKLYEASAAGVDIALLVRGNCSLQTGIAGLSDTIRINGIIDRYLEHSRIFLFANGGEERFFIGSADWMPRNLDNRIEVVAPVCDPNIQADLRTVLDFGLRDTLQGHRVDGTGENRPWTTGETQPFRSQEALYRHYAAQNDLTPPAE